MRSVEMAKKIAFLMAITLLCFCIDSAECERGSFYNPGPYDTTLVSITCNGEHFQAFSPYDAAVGDVTQDIMEDTPVRGFNHYTWSKDDGATAYEHGACNGIITEAACGRCLGQAFEDLRGRCGLSIGAQVQLRDCRMRYENYFFLEG